MAGTVLVTGFLKLKGLHQGLVKGAELCKSLLSWLAGEVNWLAVEVLSPY